MMNYKVELSSTLSSCSDKELAEMYHIVKRMAEDNYDETVYSIDTLTYIVLAFIASHNSLPELCSIFEQEIINRWNEENTAK